MAVSPDALKKMADLVRTEAEAAHAELLAGGWSTYTEGRILQTKVALCNQFILEFRKILGED